MALSEKAREILNCPALIEKRDAWFDRLEKVFSGDRTGWNSQNVFGVNGIVSHIVPFGDSAAERTPELWVEHALEKLAGQAAALENEVYFRPLCVEYPMYGVHYSDCLLGAEVGMYAGQWYNKQLATPIGQLKRPDLDAHPLWQETKRVTEAFLEADVALPLFGLPTVASVLNVAVNLYGAEILIAMLEEPEAARADLAVINDMLCEIHAWFRRTVPERQLQPVISWNRTQPPGYGQICGCSTQLLSPALYEEFIAPLDEQLLSVYPKGGMIHLCGSHTQHMDVFRRMSSLKAVQVNDAAARELKKYYDGLREDQILYLCPCEGAEVENVMEITGGKRLVIAADLEAPVLLR